MLSRTRKGAWIEIARRRKDESLAESRTRKGAWIEIFVVAE